MRETRYWFRAKRYGWGWDWPLTWEGWVFDIVWIVTMVVGMLWIARQNLALGFVFLVTMVVILFIACFAKGEPPRWRWGNDD